MVRVIKDKKPKFFVGENVKGILSINDGKFIENIISDFKALNYDVVPKVLNSVHYGVPQTRERVIIMGNRIGVKKIHFQNKHMDMEKNLIKPKTTKDVIGHLTKVALSKKNQKKSKINYY